MSNVLVLESNVVLMGRTFNIYGDFENPLFLAQDVAEWIGHSNVSTMMEAVEDDEKLIYVLFISAQNREMWFLIIV